MRIAIDLDKNYEVDRKVFNHIAERFQTAGHSVGILTARNEKEGWDTDFMPDFIYFLDIGEKDYVTRAKLKAQKMIEEKIDLIFDDRADLFPKEVVALKII